METCYLCGIELEPPVDDEFYDERMCIDCEAEIVAAMADKNGGD